MPKDECEGFRRNAQTVKRIALELHAGSGDDLGKAYLVAGMALGLTETVEALIVENERLRETFKQCDCGLTGQTSRLREVLDYVAPLLGGWREVIAEIDDLGKDEVLGKAMWAALDQIDDVKKKIRAVLEGIEEPRSWPEPGSSLWRARAKKALRDNIISKFAQALELKYPLRWADHQSTAGGFDGADTAIDVFNVETDERASILERLREAQDWAKEALGSRVLFVFHTPEATREHYAHLLESGTSTLTIGHD